jgi:hypothetical protein
MKKLACVVFAATAALALSACGKSQKADEGSQAENVEMPAEEAVNSADADATPIADASEAVADASAAAGDADKAAEAATLAAEKKTDAQKKM